MYKQKIVIVGGGIVGLSTAYALLKQGMKQVTVLEQVAIDHKRSTSHGISRLLRFEYGNDAFYSDLVQQSSKRWRTLARLTRQTLYTPTELLVLGHEGDQFTQPSYTNLRRMGLPIEYVSHHECKQYFPQFNLQGYDQFTYNHEAGILHASNCLRTLKGLITDLGGTICEGKRIHDITYDTTRVPVRLHCDDGETLTADRVVLALGPWVHTLLGELALPVRPTRQYLLYFGNLASKDFDIHTFPAFLSEDLYGFPLHSSFDSAGPCWLKVASHTFGNTINPDDEPQVEERVIAQIRKRVVDLLPAVRHATLERVDTCMYDVTPDEDFILDYHPHNAHIIFASGLTGHGFKFGPLLGEMLSSLVRDTPPPVPTTRFQLARFAEHRHLQQESVA